MRRSLCPHALEAPTRRRPSSAATSDLDGVKAAAVVTPASLSGRLVLYLHGGGHVSGSPALYGDFTWRTAAATRARTIILDHRLPPEHPFPAALDDAVTAYRRSWPMVPIRLRRIRSLAALANALHCQPIDLLMLPGTGVPRDAPPDAADTG